MRRHRRRRTTTVTLAVAAALSLAACGLPGADQGDGSDTIDYEADGSDWTGTITMFAQAYTPDSEVATGTQLTAMRTIADAYEADHEGITVEFADERYETYLDTVRVKAAAGEMWDVFWAQSNALNGALPRGIAVDLAPALDLPNQYAPDAPSWREAMNPEVITTTTAGDGSVYNINGDYVLTGWYYNQDLFDQVGAEVPTTWTEFVEVNRQFADAGINPVSYVPYYGWVMKHFISDLYSEDYDEIANLDGVPAYSTTDEALAVRDEILHPSDPRFMSWWPAMKAATDYWQEDYLTAPAARNDRAEQDFFAGNAAMYYSGSWMPNKLESSEIPFEWSSFPWPILTTEDVPGATGVDVSNVVGGPSGAYQYAMSTPESNDTMAEEGKPEAVLDWLRYLGVASNAEQVINESGEFLPTFAGAEQLPEFAEQAAIVDKPWRALVVNSIAPNLDADQQQIFGSYLGGNISLEEAAAQLTEVMEQASADYIAANDLD